MKNLVIFFDEIYPVSKSINSDIFSFSNSLGNPDCADIDLYRYIERYNHSLRSFAVEFYSNIPASIVSEEDLQRDKYRSLRKAFPGSLFSCGQHVIAGSAFEGILKIFAVIHLIESKSYRAVDFYGFPRSWISDLKAMIENCHSHIRLRFFDSHSDFLTSFLMPIFKSFSSLIRISFVNFFRISFFHKKKLIERKDLIFVDYLFDFDDLGKSRYWCDLPEILSRRYAVSMLHIFVPNKMTPDLRDAVIKNSELNDSTDGVDHFLLDSKLDVRGYFRVLLRSFFCAWESLLKLHRVPAFVVSDYLRSFCSSYVFNCFSRLQQFDSVFHSLSLDNSTLIYVGENQAWERCAVSSSFERGCREFVFSLHTTYRFWDFRYALPIVCKYIPNLSKSVESGDAKFFLACNGKFAAKSLEFQQQVASRVVECLRINSFQTVRATDKKPTRPFSIAWAIGDFEFENSRDLLRKLFSVSFFVDNYEVRFRPHPADNGRLQAMFPQVRVDRGSPLAYEHGDIVVSHIKSSFTFEAILN